MERGRGGRRIEPADRGAGRRAARAAAGRCERRGAGGEPGAAQPEPMGTLSGPDRAASPQLRGLADELLERGLFADRVEVGVSRGELAELLPALDRVAQVPERILLAPREALDARDVVGHARVLGMGFDQLTPAVGGLVVLARLIERMERRPDLPAAGLVCLPRSAAERDDRRSRLL